MIDLSAISAYLQTQTLPLDPEAVRIAVQHLLSKQAEEKPDPQDDLFRYPVPKLGDNGSCSLMDELEDEPYDLTSWFTHHIDDASRLLADLSALLKATNREIGADWLGIYSVGNRENADLLVKLVYTGIPSRAEFPLNTAFAKISNNSRVGLTGKGAVINDVSAWCEAEGSYYTCDTAINSEVCLPIMNREKKVIGIIDAEAREKDFFDSSKLNWLAALALVLSEPLENLPIKRT